MLLVPSIALEQAVAVKERDPQQEPSEGCPEAPAQKCVAGRRTGKVHGKWVLRGGREGIEAGISGRSPQLFFNPEQLIVLCRAVASAGRAGFDLARAEAHSEVRD